MKKLTSDQIRTMWLNFFQENNHYILPYSSLIPVNDFSLLWINSGIANLKPYFEGVLTPPYQNLANSQKSIRTNDIKKVGLTARHHTLFEMLGNFSIGGYFKKTAIQLAWKFLTDPEWLAIQPEKLYITVYKKDELTINLWQNIIKVPAKKIILNNKKLNFWDIGQGPCGPNTEIFYDRGLKYDPKKQGIELLKKDIENDRYIEIWNIVFSQFNHLENNQYEELPRKNIDTGAGLERITCLSQATPTNFETDLFWPIITKTATWTKQKYDQLNYFQPQKNQTIINSNFKIIADHIRAIMFAIADGVYPSSKERGYVIRRLIRRAYLKGNELGINKPFLHKLIKTCAKTLINYYDYLDSKIEIIEKTIFREETLFAKTIEKGLLMFQKITSERKELNGSLMFKLYETYGFPIELIIEEAQKRKIKYSIKEFEKVKQENIAFSKRQTFFDASLKKQNPIYLQIKDSFISTCHKKGPESEYVQEAIIKKIVYHNQIVNQIKKGTCEIIFDKSPFYAEKGGQASDNGYLIHNNVKNEIVEVFELPYKQFAHITKVQNLLKVGDKVALKVNHQKRYYTQKNHSGTHLLHAALREVLGNHVMQVGSYNDEKKLRIDINHNQKITINQLNQIENLVNKKIQANIPREIIYTNYNEAVQKYHALAFFNEKYDEEVRIVRFSDWSCELCGGTHCNNTSEVEILKIIHLESKGSNSFRLTALTSHKTVTKYWKDFVEKINKKIKLYERERNSSKELINLIKQWPSLKKDMNNYWKIVFEYEKKLADTYQKQEANKKKAKVENKTKQIIIKPELLQQKYYFFSEISQLPNKVVINWIKQKQGELNSIFLIGLITKDSLLIYLAVNKNLNLKLQNFYSFIKKEFNELNPRGGGNNNFGQIMFNSKEGIKLFKKIKEDYQKWIITSVLI